MANSDSGDSDIARELKKQHEENKEQEEKRHRDLIKELKRQYRTTIAIIVLSATALVISLIAYQDTTHSTELISELQNVAQTNFNEEHKPPILTANGEEIYLEYYSFPEVDARKGVTIRASAEHDLILSVTNATIVQPPPTTASCFFSEEPTVKLLAPENGILKRDENYTRLVPDIWLDYRLKTNPFSENGTTRFLEVQLGIIKYDIIGTDSQTNISSNTTAYSPIVLDLPVSNIQEMYHCTK